MEKLTLNSIEPTDIIEEINLDSFLINPNDEISEPIPILSITQEGYDIPIFTEENLSLIFGPAKSRKSTLIKSICQAILKGSNEKMKSTYYRNNITIVDTEQDRYRCWKMTKVLKYLTGKDINYYSMVGTKKESKRLLVEKHLSENSDCGILILDNIVHFLRDFNSVDESADLTEWLLSIKSTFNVHILMILHENASGGLVKPRGHLGTNLMNLCETIIKIEKDTNDKTQSIISAFLTRGMPFDDFTITMDGQGIPYLSDMKVYNKNKL
jgi:hypothetical protein